VAIAGHDRIFEAFARYRAYEGGHNVHPGPRTPPARAPEPSERTSAGQPCSPLQ
jgi:hypothetical protein